MVLLVDAPVLFHLLLDEFFCGDDSEAFQHLAPLHKRFYLTFVFAGQCDAKRFVETIHDVLLCKGGQNREQAKRECQQNNMQETLR